MKKNISKFLIMLAVVIIGTTSIVYAATTLYPNRGGTGLTSYTSGDIIYSTGAKTLGKLNIGSNNQFLRSNGSAPVWQTISTTDIAEGTNLYYTLDRWAEAQAGTTTDSLPEGVVNFYATQERWDSFWNASTTLDSVTTIPNLSITESQISDLTHYTSADFDTDFAGKTTTDLSEGSNLYYTDSRVNDLINASSTIWNNNTEVSLESFLSDVTNVFTDNDTVLDWLTDLVVTNSTTTNATITGILNSDDDLVIHSNPSLDGLVILGDVTTGFVFDEDNKSATIGGGSNSHDINGSTEKSIFEFHTDGNTAPGGTTYHRHSNTANLSSDITFLKSAGDHVSPLVVVDGEQIGHIRYGGYDGTDYALSAEIVAFIDGTPGDNDMPGKLVFSTTADGESTPTERMSIANDGLMSFMNASGTSMSILDILYIGKTSTTTIAGDNATSTFAGDINSSGLITGDVADSTFGMGVETISEVFIDTFNLGILDDITVSDTGGLSVSWTAGEMYDYGNETIQETNSGSGSCTNNSITYLKYTSGSATLTLTTTEPTGNDYSVAHINCQDSDIVDTHQQSMLNQRTLNLERGAEDAMPILVISGLLVSEDTDPTNAFDVTMGAGSYLHDLHENNSISQINSSTTPMVRHFRTGGAWDSDTNIQVDIDSYDNGTNRASTTPAKYHKSMFMVDGGVIHWIYPTEEFDTAGLCILGNNPAVPPGLANLPFTTALCTQTGNTSLPTAGGSQWIDIRITLTSAPAGNITDHGNLTGLADAEDHPYALLIDGSRALSSAWDVGGFDISDIGTLTAVNIVATSTTATSTFPRLSITTGISILGEYFENFTNYVRSLFTGGNHITITSGSIAVDDDFLLNDGDIGTGVFDFGGATSLEIPNSASLSFDAVAQIGYDTTSGNLVISTSTGATSVVIGSATSTLYAFSMSSTTPQILASTYKELPTHYLPQVATAIMCKVDGGTSQVINLSDDGTNDTNTATCTTSWTQTELTSNFTWNAYEDIRIEFGSRTGDTDDVIVRVIGYRQTD